MILAAVLTSVLFQQLPLAEPQTAPVVRLESRRGGFGLGEDVEISFFLQSGHQGDTAWRVHLKRDYRGPPGHVEHLDRWIDASDCPSVVLAADTLRKFRAPEAYGPGEPGRAATMAPHGTRYILTTIGAINGGEGTTVTTDLTGMILGEVANATLRQLRTCPSTT